MLRDLLEIPGGLIKSDRNKLLNTFATQPWFCDEFSKAGGHAWLERAVANVNSTEDYYSHLAMIGSAVNSRGSFTNLRDWAIAARDILTRLPKKPATDRAQLTAHHLRTIMQGQIDCKIRPADFPDIMKANVFRIFDEEKFWEDGLEEDIDAISRYNYVKSWHLQDWEDWCRYMKGIVDGLERGYINEFLPRYPIDPDGLCCKFLSD